MTGAGAKLTQIIASLAGVVERERKALLEKAFEKLEILSMEKVDLLREFEQAAAALDGIQPTDDLSRALAQIRRQAAENAEQLRALAKGVEAARETLRKIRERDADAGAYERSGASVRSSARHTVSAQM